VKNSAEHGTRSMYVLGCRCQECKAAAARAARERREKRREITAEHPELVPHGAYGGYTNWCCRCGECVKANRDYQAARARGVSRWNRYTQAKNAAARKETADGDGAGDDAAPGSLASPSARGPAVALPELSHADGHVYRQKYQGVKRAPEGRVRCYDHVVHL
jgi:hypothetical protein